MGKKILLSCALSAAVAGGLIPQAAHAVAVTLPTPNAVFDYQINGARTEPGLQIVSRDRDDEDGPAPGLYNICYVNAFQTQPITSEINWWRQNNLVLKDSNGNEVVDGAWDEILLDIRTEANRQAVAAKVNQWIDGCADDGFQAIEPDNLDSYSRSEGLLTPAHAIAYIRLLIAHAHARGLAIAQKNAIGEQDGNDGGVGTAGRDAGLDFAISEECGRFTECPDYQQLYGNRVYDVEYTSGGFANACAAVGSQISVVRRDEDVTPGGPYQVC